MKNESKITVFFLSISGIVIVVINLFVFSKMMFGNIHMHPPTDHEIRKMREEIKKDMKKYGNEKAKKMAENDEVPFLRKPRERKKRYAHPKKFRPYIN